MTLGKTAWVDRALEIEWDHVADRVKPEWMPAMVWGDEERPYWAEGEIEVEEYGCGFYGCVMPTGDPMVVLKITNDPSEAQFALQAMALAKKLKAQGSTVTWPNGIVQYFKVLQLAHVGAERDEEQTAGTARFNIYETDRSPKQSDERLYLLWRSDVVSPGFIFTIKREVGDIQDEHPGANPEDILSIDQVGYVQLGNNLSNFKRSAGWVRLAINEFPELSRAGAPSNIWEVWREHQDMFMAFAEGMAETGLAPYDFPYIHLDIPQGVPPPESYRNFSFADADPVAVGACIRLGGCQLVLDAMQMTKNNETVMEALDYYFSRGLLLADVHPGNVGLNYEGKPTIFDPGQMVRLDPQIKLKRFTLAGQAA